ncbi:fumarylacetoacetate hydrolase family protein [Halalkalibacter nanhaiisediminis]|uniref:2-keto-4-pentenoate hydratase/2-oxohepta-3-ene-1,7-dioic acid hydratase in catechol pathway n=1 Tax=Halalkalibacter nanhaiisediminis TaxID=688079 RepID=A0A562QJE1_9BACI|nr:fumarylacetoacetate hydrolase family protein [Halalkalibacter nanhaiisediminis]TWI56166.1 2-keto-4-pentenoate hydratase/2-oxohepta-3-ene-1,7-dioic acid hydratase in catechol pathway [Halalkalibacter nanhaiisediminis]
METQNIYCIGRNYAKHAEELGNAIPKQPILFSKPTHALVYTDGQVISLPKDKGEVHHEIEIVLRIDRDVQKGDRVEDVVSEIALGLDLTLRDVQSVLKEKGHPWLRAKGFKNSAIVTPFWKFEGVESLKQVDFSFVKNGDVIQKGNIQNMMFDFQAIIDECAECFGLGKGDLIYTGTPEGVGPLHSGDECILYWGAEEKGRFIVE